MSDNIVKIIPQDPYDKIPESTLLKAQIFLEGEIQCDFIETKNSEIPMFIDCGSNFEKILCPVCGKELNFKWCGETVNNAYKSMFASLKTKLPCCGNIISLNELKYQFPCGFACWIISIINPIGPIKGRVTDSVQKILGVNVRIIEAHI